MWIVKRIMEMIDSKELLNSKSSLFYFISFDLEIKFYSLWHVVVNGSGTIGKYVPSSHTFLVYRYHQKYYGTTMDKSFDAGFQRIFSKFAEVSFLYVKHMNEN